MGSSTSIFHLIIHFFDFKYENLKFYLYITCFQGYVWMYFIYLYYKMRTYFSVYYMVLPIFKNSVPFSFSKISLFIYKITSTSNLHSTTLSIYFFFHFFSFFSTFLFSSHFLHSPYIFFFLIYFII